PMASPLTVVIPLNEEADIAKMAGIIVAQEAKLQEARAAVSTLHYTWFLILDHSSPDLQPQPGSSGPFSFVVVVVFDGTLEDYLREVSNELSPAFTLLLSNSTDGRQLLPVSEHFDDFVAYIRAHNACEHPPAGDMVFFGAYPDTAVEILAKAAPE
ncbi:MAG: hypothetical protein QOG56_259, partial [Solirubrobacteraceae bacterium]|nr:hypothetical protein [Solirubrobacteraceae bacterium]